MGITYSNVAGQEPSTVTFRAATVSIGRGSTTEVSEIMVLGDPQTSNGIARVVASPPVSTEFGLCVRIVGGPSSAVDLPVQISGNSTAIIQGNSTVIQGTSPWVIGFQAGNISSAAQSGASSGLTVRPVWSSTNADQPVSATQSGAWTVRANLSSTGADNPVSGNSTVFQGSSAWQVQVTSMPAGSTSVSISGNSTAFQGGTWTVQQGNAPWTFSETMQSSVAPSSGSSGVIVRPVIDNILTTASSNAFGTSTTLSIQSSAASLRSYVTAFSITSTVQAVTKVAFMSGSTLLWPVAMAALSSAFSGVNLAVSAPAYLFRTKSAGPLSLNTGNSSIAGWKVAVSYFRAP